MKIGLTTFNAKTTKLYPTIMEIIDSSLKTCIKNLHDGGQML